MFGVWGGGEAVSLPTRLSIAGVDCPVSRPEFLVFKAIFFPLSAFDPTHSFTALAPVLEALRDSLLTAAGPSGLPSIQGLPQEVLKSQNVAGFLNLGS